MPLRIDPSYSAHSLIIDSLTIKMDIHGDFLWIPTERVDVLLHPAERFTFYIQFVSLVKSSEE
jgi:hypothetical protein